MAEAPRAIGLGAYLDRIGYTGPAAPDEATLRALHARHAEAIPFENLAAFLGEPVRLDTDSLQEKLVTRRRGGWCFEHNLLFAQVLEAIGYPVRRLAARVRWNVPQGVVTARSHMLMEVEVAGEPWIADVGFGGQSLTGPLRLVPWIEQETPHERFRLAPEGDAFAVQAWVEGEWRALYAFERQAQQLADYEVSNWYLANHPQSQFVTGVIAARAAPGLRHALRNARYAIHHRDGRTERRTLRSADEVMRVLSDAMRIPLPDQPRLEDKLARMLREASQG